MTFATLKVDKKNTHWKVKYFHFLDMKFIEIIKMNFKFESIFFLLNVVWISQFDIKTIYFFFFENFFGEKFLLRNLLLTFVCGKQIFKIDIQNWWISIDIFDIVNPMRWNVVEMETVIKFKFVKIFMIKC